MRQISGYSLWVGRVADIRDLRGVLSAGIEAVVDLALNEPVALVTRELVYCRFPLVDGAGNPFWGLCAAVEAVAGFVRVEVPTLVFCGAGMSRSLTVAAAGLALAGNRLPGDCLQLVTATGPHDVSVGLWNDIVETLRRD
ncbi:Uncharacterized protein OS=Planctomyces maris DSM 8797 GN=PM8797T_22478 PE=4 SV=1 [Gemmata massiliana]|uniref:Tyrosine specific protein phosphatases domain-containing protein n=1 Tax=Gemmata massiliana TaxID=1210884 RepID=A0A6P2CV80_9BACT|nr:dual specificity protein phosphatase family protein [Gemmata massiliana]VTR92286.1 Uncharacterized protein OS=Planctomyces maris DSM 8797 GN=PM8797T_22478 PE=4 SV=1 [Gemmata massiliana]